MKDKLFVNSTDKTQEVKQQFIDKYYKDKHQ